MNPLVIKFGGAILKHPEILAQLFQAIAQQAQTQKCPIVILHGGGYLVDDLMRDLNFDIEKKQGLRVTPSDQIHAVVGALAGTANKLLQAHAIKAGIRSVGLSLADGNLCQVTPLDPCLGHVGQAHAGDPTLVHTLLASDHLVLLSSIGITDQGQLMNVNADQAAVAVAKVLNAKLLLLSDVPGVLDENRQCIAKLSQSHARELINAGVITDGMIVKVQAAFDAADQLGRAIQVASWKDPENFKALLAGQGIGTQFHDTNPARSVQATFQQYGDAVNE